MKLKHVISTKQFTDKTILKTLFENAAALEKLDNAGLLPQAFSGKVIATVFYEPSTRTRFSFEAAMKKLGGQVITTESAGHFSSATKGETLQDSVRVIAGYADAIIILPY